MNSGTSIDRPYWSTLALRNFASRVVTQSKAMARLFLRHGVNTVYKQRTKPLQKIGVT